MEIKKIHLYAKNGKRDDLINYLNNNPINIDIKGEKNCTPLHYASREKKLEIVEILLQYNADIHQVNDYATRYAIFEVLNSNVEEENLPFIKLFLAKGIDKSLTDAFGNTPLHYAIEQNDIALVEFLLQNNFDANLTKREDKDTPLHYACFQKNSTIINLLIKHGANQTLCNIYNKRAKEYL